MTAQRKGRNAQSAIVYKTTSVVDDRGNEQVQVDMDNGVEVMAAFTAASTRDIAVAGQATHEQYTMIVRPDIPDVGMWSVVEWRGEFWDVVAPPEYHHGTRHVRHWSVKIRRRMGGGA